MPDSLVPRLMNARGALSPQDIQRARQRAERSRRATATGDERTRTLRSKIVKVGSSRTRSSAGAKRIGRRRRKLSSDTKDETPATEVRHSPFLNLPPELRNLVYEFSAADHTAVLRSKCRGRLISNCPLTAVSRQVRDEYLSLLCLTEATITAYVTDMDFSHIVTFLNKLSDRELKAMPSINIPSSRIMRIILRITDQCPKHSDLLDRWLLRLEHPTKRGTALRTSYTVLGRSIYYPRPEDELAIHPLDPALVAYRNFSLGSPPHLGTPVGRVMRKLQSVLQKMEKAEVEGRVYDELKAIVMAFRNSVP